MPANGRRTRRRCAISWMRGPRSSAWSARPGTCTSPRRCAPISPRASRWCATPSRSSVRRAGGCSSTQSISSTGTAAIPLSRCRCVAAAEEAGAERLVLCDTNGGMLPFDIAEDGRPSGPGSVPLGIHVHNDAGCAVANSLGGRRRRRAPGAGHGERLRRAHRQRRHRADQRGPHLEDGRDRRAARGIGGAPHRAGALRRGDREPLARGAAAVRRPLRLHAQGGVAHERRRTRLDAAYEHVHPSPSGTVAASWPPTTAAARRSG